MIFMLALVASAIFVPATADLHDFCSHIAKDPPKHCTCANNANGFTFTCSVSILGKDTINLNLDVNPCEAPMTAALILNDTRFHLHHELAGLTANDKAIHVPFPGLSLKIGKIANAGVMIDFDLTSPADSGDKHLDLSLGFDLCATVKILGKHKTICGSKISKHLPLEVLDKSYDFTDVCTNSSNTVAVSNAHMVVSNAPMVVSNAPTNWTDCGLPNATIKFDQVSSTNPVHTHETQFINKTMHFNNVSYSNITCEYEQYWKVLGQWFRFLDLRVDSCAEHPTMCNAKPNTEIFVETKHPPLNPLTPHGMYRSKQTYRDGSTNEVIGCVDMMIPYVK
jgi:hypothetical protein